MARGGGVERPAEGGFEDFDRDAAGPQQDGCVAVEAENGRFEPDRAGTAVEDRGDAAVEIGAHMGGAWWR